MISLTTWVVTIAFLALVIAFDLVLAILRRNKETSVIEAAGWTIFYIAAAIAFGYFLPHWASAQGQKEFFAGWLTEYALSVDNIFVFIIILGHLHVKKEKQQLVLLLGIMLTIAIRGALIPLGAALISYLAFNTIFVLLGSIAFARAGGFREWVERSVSYIPEHSTSWVIILFYLLLG